MYLNAPTHAAILLVAIGGFFALPVLLSGFKRRGKGIKYESNFLIQRAPQLASLATAVIISGSFVSFNHLLFKHRLILCAADLLPIRAAIVVSWGGIALLASGLVFMIGGWYSLGKFFSTDAELQREHQVCSRGLYQFVMHPAYSGIIQCLLGASIAALSPSSLSLVLFLVAPLWLERAKYEEQLLLEHLGKNYRQYADGRKWRRLVPNFIPFGL